MTQILDDLIHKMEPVNPQKHRSDGFQVHYIQNYHVSTDQNSSYLLYIGN